MPDKPQFSTKADSTDKAERRPARIRRDPEIEVGTILAACKILGGEEKPISTASFYRGVNAGRYDPPFHPSPGVSRVNLTAIRELVRLQAQAAAGDRPSTNNQPTES